MPVELPPNVSLLVELVDGKPFKENVRADPIGSNKHLLIKSPGYLINLAAGDEFEVLDPMAGTYRVTRRGGNVCVQFYTDSLSTHCRSLLETKMREIGGYLDGESHPGGSVLAFTIPVSVGFPAIERVMADVMKQYPESEWFYGNVYAEDGITPLNWWQ